MFLEITKELGQEVITRLAEYITVDINIINIEGKIIASTNNSRINEFHTGGLQVIQSGKKLIIDSKNLKNFPNTKQGINLPIIHRNSICGAVGISGHPEEILSIVNLVKISVELVLDQIYMQEKSFIYEKKQLKWMQYLLHPSGFDEDFLQKEAELSLGIDVKQYWKAVVVFVDKNLKTQFSYLVNKHFRLSGIEPLFKLQLANNEFLYIISPDIFESTIRKVLNIIFENLNKRLHIGIGKAEFGIKGIKESYNQAKKAIKFAGEKYSIAHIDDWPIERLISCISTEEIKSACEDYISSIKYLDKEITQTLNLFIKTNFSTQETADILHIHRNTLLYRLQQFKQKTNLNPKSFNDMFIYKVIKHNLCE